MESRIRATQAVRSFSDILNRVRYRGETFVIERGGEPVCRLTPVESAPVRFTGKDLVQLLEKLPRPDAGYFDEVERAAKEQPKLRASPWGR
jgi:antitoxin (DNA-binding transcriptional repressor) of toxin-antitoxin stability system